MGLHYILRSGLAPGPSGASLIANHGVHACMGAAQKSLLSGPQPSSTRDAPQSGSRAPSFCVYKVPCGLYQDSKTPTSSFGVSEPPNTVWRALRDEVISVAYQVLCIMTGGKVGAGREGRIHTTLSLWMPRYRWQEDVTEYVVRSTQAREPRRRSVKHVNTAGGTGTNATWSPALQRWRVLTAARVPQGGILSKRRALPLGENEVVIEPPRKTF